MPRLHPKFTDEIFRVSSFSKGFCNFLKSHNWLYFDDGTGTCELLAASLHFQGMDAGRPNSYKVVFVLDCDGGGGRAAVGSRVCYGTS